MTTLKDIAAGLPGYDEQALTVAHARHIIQKYVEPIAASENLAIRAALGRVVAVDIRSPIDVPAHDNSAMDGYAFHGSDLRPDLPTTLKIVGVALAGHPYAETVNSGECVRIMTGAVVPAGCDTVVPQENADAGTAIITIAADTIEAGANCRARGEDLQAGATALRVGRILRPSDLGLLASLGIAEVAVQRRLRVAFFSTGDELRPVGTALEAGCVYDSNRYTLHAMLTRLGCEAIDLGVVRDDPAALDTALRNACSRADAVISSGGASTGAADYIRQAATQLGEVAFWGMAMRPGRPLAFGKISDQGKSAYLFGLPGNPVATMVSFYVFVRAALLQMMGVQDAPLPLLRAAAQSSIRKRPGRTEYLRGIVSSGPDGAPQVQVTGAQGSGILRSMSEANCLVALRHDQADVGAGDAVDVLLFDGLV